MTSLVVSTDGYCAPNPGGLATWAFVAEEGGVRRAAESGVAADPGSSEIGEWRAAFEALAWLARHAPDGARVSFRSDHARVVKALADEAPVPAEGEERRLAQECRRLWKELYERNVLVAFARVPRWENAEADRLASEAHARALGAPARPADAPAASEEGERFDLPPSRRGNR